MIVRKKLEGNYTRIPNEFLLDETISDKARGTLARLLSRPDTWNVNVNHLVKTGKDGHTALRSSLTELEGAGYLHKEVTRGEGGRITGTRYLVFDHRVDPADVEKIPSHDKPQIRDTHVNDDDRMRETMIRESGDVITNKSINKSSGVTTTTPGQEVKQDPVIEPPVEPSQSYPATELLNLIPEQHQQPPVMALVNQAVKKYSALELEEAITYATANVKGGVMQYKAYLDKTLKNKWAVGYLETMKSQTTSPALLSPGGFTGAVPAGRYPNGSVTGCKRMDSNYMAAAAFLNRRRGIS